EMEGHGFPSKVYTIMACAKPLLVCSGENTPIYRFLHPLGCSYLISENNLIEKVKQIKTVLKSVEKGALKQKGESGLNEILAKYSNHSVTRQYVELGNKLIQKDE
ncbi:hypothetical protein, partial [Pedobacter sp.]|uniref:hypothetical protein n=1 Tax=Pedobacter sp. TaxID=1411316 RepID=UPI002C25572C